MVFGSVLEMFGQGIYPFSEDGDLDFRRTGISRMEPVFLYETTLLFL
jgi:hypothetical protein